MGSKNMRNHWILHVRALKTGLKVVHWNRNVLPSMYWLYMCCVFLNKLLYLSYYIQHGLILVINQLNAQIMFIGPCIIVIVEEWKINLMSLPILFHFLCARHVSDINISIIKRLRLFCWITTLVYCSWIPLQPNHTETPTHIEPRTIRPIL